MTKLDLHTVLSFADPRKAKQSTAGITVPSEDEIIPASSNKGGGKGDGGGEAASPLFSSLVDSDDSMSFLLFLWCM